MASNIKLTYFTTRGLGEVIRILLKYGEIDFEDERIERAEWPKIKSGTPFGQLPVYEENGKVVGQTNAIARYIAKKVKLGGDTDWEDLTIDSIVDTIEDLKTKIMAIPYEPDTEKRNRIQDSIMNETLPYYFERFNNIARQNNGHLALSRLTWADIMFTTLTDAFLILLGEDILDQYESLLLVRNNVLAVPSIKAWVEVRPTSHH